MNIKKFGIGTGAGFGGKYFIYAILLVCVLYVCFAFSACELNDILSGCKGSLGKLLDRAFGPAISIVLNLMTNLIIAIVVGSAETIFASRMVSNTFFKGVPYQCIAVVFILIIY